MTLHANGYHYYLDEIDALYQLYKDRYYLNYNFYNNRAKRGDISVTLTSPQGSTSTLLFNRPYDIVTKEGYLNWPFLSVLHWGENPNGQWTIQVYWKNSKGSARMSNINISLYGVSETPTAVSGTPTAMSETPTAVSGTPTAMSGKPTAVSGTPTAVSERPTAVSRTPTSVSGRPTSVSGIPTALSGTPTATSGTPITMSGTPTAVSGTPTAVSNTAAGMTAVQNLFIVLAFMLVLLM